MADLLWAGVGLGTLQRCHPASVPLQFDPTVLSHSTKFQLIKVFVDIMEEVVLLYKIMRAQMATSVNKVSKLNKRLNKMRFSTWVKEVPSNTTLDCI